jgi:hypothetical protein
MTELFNWKPFEKGALKGFFSIKLPSGLVINGMSYYEKPDGKRWVNFPAKKFTSESGTVTWQPHVEIPDKGLAETFRSMCLSALDAMNQDSSGKRVDDDAPSPRSHPDVKARGAR